MVRIATTIAVLILVGHGFFHLMGTAIHMGFAKIKGLPYMTTVAGGRIDLGRRGIRLFGLLWLVPALGFIVSAAALLAGWEWWRPAVVLTSLFSLVLTGLDWRIAFAGAIVDVGILAVLLGPSLMR